jgi:hypothetical protein
VQAAHSHLVQDPFGVEAVGFSEADVEAIGRYLRSLLPASTTIEHGAWSAMKAGETHAFALAVHESVQINSLYAAGEDPYLQFGRTGRLVYQAAHRQAVAAEARYWLGVARQQGYSTTAAALEAEHFYRRHTGQHGLALGRILQEQGWAIPTAAERYAARQFFRALGLI